jgi:hypothetical protein
MSQRKPSRPRHTPRGGERLESRRPLAGDVVDPNSGWIDASQFQPYGYSLLGTQLSDVTAGNGAALRYDVPVNGQPVPPPATYQPPTAPVNSGAITASQFNAGGFATIGVQLARTAITGALLVDAIDQGVGRPAAGGSPSVSHVIGPNPLPMLVPAGTPEEVVTQGIVTSSQFNDGGFGAIGIQASDVTIGGDLAIVLRDSVDPAIVAATTSPVPSQVIPDLTANQGTITGSQFTDGGFGDVGLQWQGVAVGRSLEVGLDRIVVQPTTAARPGTIPQLAGSFVKGSRTVRLRLMNAAAQSTPKAAFRRAVEQLYSGMSVYGVGIRPNTTIRSIVRSNGTVSIQISRRASVAGVGVPVFFSTSDTGTNTGRISSSQFADGGFGDIGLQWSGVKVDGRVATRTNGLEIQPESGAGAISQGGRTFGPLQPADMAVVGAAVPSTPAFSSDGPPATVPAAGGTPTSNDATNSGSVTGSQFADGGFGDIGLQWRNVHVSGDVEATHNSISIQPENRRQGRISVGDVSFAGTAPAFAASPALPTLAAAPDPALSRAGTPSTPAVPTPTNPGPTPFKVNAATNSGLIRDSQFADGGFGDIGLQWSDVKVNGGVKVVHQSLSVQPEGGALAGVSVSDVRFGDAVPMPVPGASGPLAPATLPSLVVPATPAPSTPGWIPDPMFRRRANAANLADAQFLSGAGSAATFQWSTTTFAGGQLTVVNNVLTVINNATTTAPITLADVTFPGAVPPLNATPASPSAGVQTTSLGRRPTVSGPVPTLAAARSSDAATNSGSLQGSQFLDGGMGDIGLQWRGVTVNGAVTIHHNSLTIAATGNADGLTASTGPIVIAGVSFNSGLNALAAPGDGIFVTPPVVTQLATNVPPAPGGGGGGQGASNSGTLTGGQFLDGGLGAVGMQMKDVIIDCPVAIVNNVLSIVVSGVASQGVTIRDVTFA